MEDVLYGQNYKFTTDNGNLNDCSIILAQSYLVSEIYLGLGKIPMLTLNILRETPRHSQKSLILVKKEMDQCMFIN